MTISWAWFSFSKWCIHSIFPRTSQLWTTPCRCESPRVKFILVHAKLVDTFYFYIPWSWNTRQSPRARSALNSSARPFKLRVSTIHDSKIKLLEIFILWNSCLKFFKQIKILLEQWFEPAVFYFLSIVITLQKSMSCQAACKKSIPIKVFLSFVETIAPTKQSIVTPEDPCN